MRNPITTLLAGAIRRDDLLGRMALICGDVEVARTLNRECLTNEDRELVCDMLIVAVPPAEIPALLRKYRWHSRGSKEFLLHEWAMTDWKAKAS